MNDINLVSGRSVDLEKQAKRLKLLRISALACLLLVALASVIFFIITFTLPISSVKKTQQETLSGISLLHKRLVTYSLIAERLKSISSVISIRSDFPSVTNTILSLVSQDLSIDTFNLDAKTLDMTVSGDSLIPMNKLIDDMVSLANSGKIIKNLSVQNLIYNSATGKYSLVFQADVI